MRRFGAREEAICRCAQMLAFSAVCVTPGCGSAPAASSVTAAAEVVSVDPPAMFLVARTAGRTFLLRERLADPAPAPASELVLDEEGVQVRVGGGQILEEQVAVTLLPRGATAACVARATHRVRWVLLCGGTPTEGWDGWEIVGCEDRDVIEQVAFVGELNVVWHSSTSLDQAVANRIAGEETVVAATTLPGSELALASTEASVVIWIRGAEVVRRSETTLVDAIVRASGWTTVVSESSDGRIEASAVHGAELRELLSERWPLAACD